MNKISEHISEQASRAKQAKAKLTHRAKRYHARRSFLSRRSHDNVQQSLKV